MSTRVATQTGPQLALQSYLDELLQDAALELEQSQAVEVDEFQLAVSEELKRDAQALQAMARTVPAPAALAPPPAPVVAPAPAPAIAPTPAPIPAPALPVAPVAEVVTPAAAPVAAPVSAAPPPKADVVRTPAPPPPPAQLGRPAWGEEPFECLLFDVAGLTLAVPLVCLGTVHSLQGLELTPIFGQPDWFLGMMSTHSGNLKVLDTARWVMPERYREEFRDHLKFVITIQGYDWGLAVHKVDRSIHLQPDQVKWRSQRTQRPWLAGTVIDHMCALLDVAALAELIRSGAHKRKV
jgi:purine-binding chemotaxis protein CheW